jgi:hypothetical protein
MSHISSLPFVVGATYADRIGEYKVISVENTRIVFEYADGQRCEGDAEQKARIYRNIQLESKSPTPAQPRRRVRISKNSVHAFTHADVFPVIAAIIEAHSSQSSNYITHDEIVEILLKCPEAGPFLNACPTEERKSTEWWAHNMVAWFSKVFTDGLTDWNHRFERTKIDNKWAYKVAEGARHLEGRPDQADPSPSSD